MQFSHTCNMRAHADRLTTIHFNRGNKIGSCKCVWHVWDFEVYYLVQIRIRVTVEYIPVFFAHVFPHYGTKKKIVNSIEQKYIIECFYFIFCSEHQMNQDVCKWHLTQPQKSFNLHIVLYFYSNSIELKLQCESQLKIYISQLFTMTRIEWYRQIFDKMLQFHAFHQWKNMC